jgi:hypothetical protein
MEREKSDRRNLNKSCDYMEEYINGGNCTSFWGLKGEAFHWSLILHSDNKSRSSIL